MKDADYILVIRTSIALALFSASLVSVYIPGLEGFHKIVFVSFVRLASFAGWMDIFVGTLLFWLSDAIACMFLAGLLLRPAQESPVKFKRGLGAGPAPSAGRAAGRSSR